MSPVRSKKKEIFGVILLGLCVWSLFCFFGYRPCYLSWLQHPPEISPNGIIGTWFAFIGFFSVGIAGYLIPGALLLGGLLLTLRPDRTIGSVWSWLFSAIIAIAGLFEYLPWPWVQRLTETLNIGSPGGVIGQSLAIRTLGLLIGHVGAAIAFVVLLSIALLQLTGMHPFAPIAVLWSQLSAWEPRKRDRAPQVEDDELDLAPPPKPKKKKRERKKKAADDEVFVPPSPIPTVPNPLPRAPQPSTIVIEPTPAPPEPIAVAAPPSDPAPEEQPPPEPPRPKSKPARAPQANAKPKAKTPPLPKRKPEPEPEPDWVSASVDIEPKIDGEHYQLPPIDLLDELPDHPGAKENTAEKSQILQNTLEEFGVDGTVTHVESGPTVTSYEVTPAPGVRVSRITALERDIARAMRAQSIRIQAPIPGKDAVGIEIPNSVSSPVFLRQLAESNGFHDPSIALPLALGSDVSGNMVVGDLARMPHMLIAGATGAGKTVCMNSLLTGLLLNRSPEQMRMILVDPKTFEFQAYENLKHLVVPIITEAKKVALGLRWAIKEMEKRYALFKKVKVRDIQSFNRRPIEPASESDEAPAPPSEVPAKLPYIVIVIDELADLMGEAQQEIEPCIVRLAQLSRAAGIHMILATQRPSVNVITGTIKANIPGRIAFQVAQGNDSRTILDSIGAEKLLGRGDMLYLPPGKSKPVRLQGTWTKDDEMNRVTDFVRQQGEPDFITEITQKIESDDPAEFDDPGEEKDAELVERALDLIRRTQRASTSSIQRHLRIGYNRAANVIDLLEERGIVGPPTKTGPREILVDLDEEIPDNPSEFSPCPDDIPEEQ